MAIRSYKPTTPARRKMTSLVYDGLTKKKTEKKLTKGRKRSKGRNAQGKITTRHKGGGHKRRYRQVDFKQDKEKKAKIQSIEYDPNRTAFIALAAFEDGEKRYILAPEEMRAGDEIEIASKKIAANPGNRMQLEFIPDGSFVHNVELNPGQGGKLIRSAGNYAQLMSKEGKYAQLKFPSGEIRNVLTSCKASLGQLSNIDHSAVFLGKAGRKRWLGVKPTVTGKSMNPVDHPHGGGEGHSPIGLRKGPKTPWGKKALGVKTRKRNKRSNKFIVKRRKG